MVAWSGPKEGDQAKKKQHGDTDGSYRAKCAQRQTESYQTHHTG